MGTRHSRPERKKWARLTQTVSIQEVARRAGVKVETVRGWRTEFSITSGTAPDQQVASSLTLGREGLELDDDAGAPSIASLASENELESDVQEAVSAYLEQNQPWFQNADQRRSDADEMRRVVADWENDHGKLTRKEKAEARARLSA